VFIKKVKPKPCPQFFSKNAPELKYDENSGTTTTLA